MENKAKKGNLPVLIICIVVFLVLWFIQGRLSARPNETAEAAKAAFEGIANQFQVPADRQQAVTGPLTGLINAGNSSLNGIIAQLQVLISVVLVLTNRKKGFITATILNAFNALFVLIVSYLIRGAKGSLPGAVVSIVTIIIAAIIYFFLTRNDKMHQELSASYQEAIENNRIIQEKDEVLQYLAYYDRLTQMPNRQLFMETLEENIKNGDDCTVIYVDLDDFRRINDNFGHSTGDELLVAYSKQIEKLCGDDSFAAKIGGDEYGIILGSGLSTDDIVSFVSSVSEIFGRPVDIRGDSFTISASFGAASFPADARSAEDLFRCAETAMFTAKTNGKNQLCFYRRAQ